MASESRLAQVGTTIPVRNVQDLAAGDAGELTSEALERYIRPDIDKDAVLYEDSGELPVVDLGRLLDPQHWEEEAAKLTSACEEWGFFQVLNHGVPEEVMVNIKRNIQEFFQLPLDVKNCYAQTPGDLQGYGQAYVVSNDQKLDWSDMLGIITQPPQARDMKHWPTQPLTFRKSLEDYSVELKKVAHSIATAIGRILNIDPELMNDKYAVQVLRMNYYPPCMSMPEKVLGFSPHSDGSFLTILSQVNSVQGLQIRRHDAWIPVKPHPEALLVNVGDLLEIMTNGKFKSIEHRVIINAHKERLSVSAFHNPKFDGGGFTGYGLYDRRGVVQDSESGGLFCALHVKQTRWKASLGLCEAFIARTNVLSILWRKQTRNVTTSSVSFFPFNKHEAPA